MNNNPFVALAESYMEYTKMIESRGKMYALYKGPFEYAYIYEKRRKKLIKELKNIAQDANMFDSIKLPCSKIKIHYDDIERSAELSNWFGSIRDYIEFIDFAEKCYMYRNQVEATKDVDKICVVANNDAIVITNTYDKYSVSIEFEESEIVQLEVGKEYDPLRDFIENGNSGRNITFVSINITRDFGRHISSNFRFVLGEEPNFNSYEDQTMFDNMKKFVSDSIIRNYCDIVNKAELGDRFSVDRAKFEDVLKDVYDVRL